MRLLNVAMLISGGASTANEITKACRDGKLAGLVNPGLVVASNYKSTEQGRKRLIDAGMGQNDVKIIRPKDYSNLEQFGQALMVECRRRDINFIGQYGWMALTPKNVIDAFPGMMVNQHPGPLDPGYPDFGGHKMFGLAVHAARLYFARETGYDLWTEATTQRVNPKFDLGEVVLRRQMEILKTDTPESLQKRLLPIEWLLQIDALELFAKEQAENLVRGERLVKIEEFRVLYQAKQFAKMLYAYH